LPRLLLSVFAAETTVTSILEVPMSPVPASAPEPNMTGASGS